MYTIRKLLNKWYLIVIFGIIGLLVSYISIIYSTSTYQVNASIFVPKQSIGIEIGFEGLLPDELTYNTCEIFNQIEIIKSYYVNEKVVQNLKWRTSWYRKDLLSWKNLYKQKDTFHWTAYYKNEPFHVEEIEGKSNKSGVRLYVTPLSDIQYEISAKGNITSNVGKKMFSFNSIGTFGIPFENDFFHFVITLNQKILPEKCRYFFIFNNLDQLTGFYRAKLDVKLKDEQSDLINLQLTSNQPKQGIDYLNELISVYIINKKNYQRENQKQSMFFIEKQLKGISDSLDSAAKNFSEFKSKNQITNISKQGIHILRMLKEVESEKNENQIKLDYLYNLLHYIEQTPDFIYMASPSIVGIQDATFNKIIQNLSNLISRRQITTFSSEENNPVLIMINKEIIQTQAHLKENLLNLIKNTEVINMALFEQIVYRNFQLTSLPKSEQKLIKYQHKFEMTDETYTYLSHKRAEIDIALAGATSAVHIIDSARMETTRLVSLSSKKKLIIGLLFGLTFPGMLFFGINIFSNTIMKKEDIEINTRLPILGNIMHNRVASYTPVADNPNSVIAEAFRKVRVNIQFILSNQEKKIISIHSINSGDGKSFTAVNISTILAMNNKKVIIIGCDMYKPILHKIFNTSNEQGLSTYLSGKDDIENVVLETNIQHLSLLPAGPCPNNPSELMNQTKMSQLLKTLSTQYDYAVLDNAPLSQVTEGLLLGRHSDLNIFILRYGISKKRQLNYINQLFENKKLNCIALIVNDISGSEFGWGFKDCHKSKNAVYFSSFL